MNYPDFIGKLSKSDHLLFDIGYSTALLWRVKEVLRTIMECSDYPVQVDDLLAAIEEFEAKRLNMRSEIYANAEEAARKGAVNHASQKTISS